MGTLPRKPHKVWAEHDSLVEAMQTETWEPLLRGLGKLEGFGPLSSGVLADHLRRRIFFVSTDN